MKHLRLLLCLVLLVSVWMSAQLSPSKVHPEQYLSDALLEYQARYGINSIPYAHALNKIGNVYLSIGNYEEAESCFLKAREIFALKLGKRNLDYALATSNLSAVYSKLAIVERTYLIHNYTSRKRLKYLYYGYKKFHIGFIIDGQYSLYSSAKIYA